MLPDFSPKQWNSTVRTSVFPLLGYDAIRTGESTRLFIGYSIQYRSSRSKYPIRMPETRNIWLTLRSLHGVGTKGSEEKTSAGTLSIVLEFAFCALPLANSKYFVGPHSVERITIFYSVRCRNLDAII